MNASSGSGRKTMTLCIGLGLVFGIDTGIAVGAIFGGLADAMFNGIITGVAIGTPFGFLAGWGIGRWVLSRRSAQIPEQAR